MAISRRSFLKAGLCGSLLGPTRLLGTGVHTRLLSCRSSASGAHFFSMLDLQGDLLLDIPLPGRGHGIALNATGTVAAVFARRPGEFLYLIDLAGCQLIQSIQAVQGRHYYGHGVFNRDGLLLSSENDYAAGTGCIGIYAANQDYARIGEISSHGIGPHELRLLQDQQTLVVANGGIRTHPDLPRIKTNLDTMQPNLAYVDIRRGRLLQQLQPPAQWHQLSIRHIDVSADDDVAIAMQYQGKARHRPPLIAIQRGDQALRMLHAPDPVQSAMRNYCGSVAFSADGSRFAVSSPRGGLVSYWSTQGDYLGMHKQADACGLSKLPEPSNAFMISDGGGQIRRVAEDLQPRAAISEPGWRWDNHMLSA